MTLIAWFFVGWMAGVGLFFAWAYWDVFIKDRS